MKISKCKINGEDGYVYDYKQDGKRKRKYFYSRKDADAFKRNLENSITPSAKIVNSFSAAQMTILLLQFIFYPKGELLSRRSKRLGSMKQTPM